VQVHTNVSWRARESVVSDATCGSISGAGWRRQIGVDTCAPGAYPTARMQRAAIVFTLLAPFALWAACRRFPTVRFDTLVRRTLALALVAFDLSSLAEKFASGGATLATALPMHLCHWVLYAVAASLWFKWQLGFELGYFWGLAGTIQALITPAIDVQDLWWRTGVFFFSHALIVVSVLHLLITARCRPWPRSLLRVAVCSEIYIALALLVNAATGGNYGFLAHKPAQASLLDFFSDAHWLYVVQINLVAFVFFPVLYLPWFVWDRLKPAPDS
jgi:hypothetical integral membrane protein (TIGR02206 family)